MENGESLEKNGKKGVEVGIVHPSSRFALCKPKAWFTSETSQSALPHEMNRHLSNSGKKNLLRI